jgi:hypothetical protein
MKLSSSKGALTIPPNFDKEASRNVAIGAKGQVELVERGDYLTAHVVFMVGHGRIAFSIPKSGLTLSVAIPNPPERPVVVGSDLLIADSLDGRLVIRTPDHGVSLDQVLDIVHELSARHSFTAQRPNNSRVGC